jgi:hypothetical protein
MLQDAEMTSSTYQLMVQAMKQRKQVLCFYKGFPRAVCPIILGHKKGQERVLAFQFDGGASEGLPRGGEWKCLELAKMDHVELRTGQWHAGRQHTEAQHCVDEVDIDVNPDSPYEPRRKLVKPGSPGQPKRTAKPRR